MAFLTAHADRRLSASESSNHEGRSQSGPALHANSKSLEDAAFIGPVLADPRCVSDSLSLSLSLCLSLSLSLSLSLWCERRAFPYSSPPILVVQN
jgi:hypothetical protein